MVKYNTILADPPWYYRDKASAGKRGVGFKYPLITDDKLKTLPVSDIAADDCCLFMWVTMPKLPEAFEVIKAWGFEYKTCAFTWVKLNKKSNSWFWGMGNWTRSNTELCLLATRGHPNRASAGVHSVISSRIEGHSKKPDEVRERIVKLCGNLPRIELFARERVPGWDAVGFDIDGKDIFESIINL